MPEKAGANMTSRHLGRVDAEFEVWWPCASYHGEMLGKSQLQFPCISLKIYIVYDVSMKINEGVFGTSLVINL